MIVKSCRSGSPIQKWCHGKLLGDKATSGIQEAKLVSYLELKLSKKPAQSVYFVV